MLDKRALRQFASGHPAPAIPANHGLLHAPQVDHVIRTAVRIIGRRRTLVLYIYDCKRVAAGDPSPAWTMFQAGDDYITRAVQEDGSTGWRTAAFERLGNHYCFTSRCAFYSVQDEERVCGFFHDDVHGGVTALVRAQKAILDMRAQERQLRREKKTIDRMSPIRALPRGLNGWIRREIMPAYFRCWHASAKKPVAGTCTSCGKESTLPGAAHNAKVVCPHCGRKLTVKSAGKTGRHFDRDTVQVIERTGAEVVTRIVKVYYHYDRDRLAPKEEIYESARLFVRQGPNGKAVADPYYYSYGKGTLTHWMPGERPIFSHYQYSFDADLCGHVYPGGLPEALAGTPWEYCPVGAFYGHFQETMALVPFLAAYLDHPRLEHLVKTGFFRLASDLAYRGDSGHALDESQCRTHRILKVAAEDVPFLRELDADMGTLKVFHGYAALKDRQRLLRWQLDYQVTRDVDQALRRMTPHKFLRYMDAQYAAPSPDGGHGRYDNMQQAVSAYRDYLDMCAKLDYDMSNGFVLYPRDLWEAHDKAQGRLKAKADAQMRRDFKMAMEAVSGRLDYEQGGLKIILPATPEEIVAEGHALHHCVGSYVDRVARKECVILFLRQCGDVGKPFYTVEIRGRKVVQVRGWNNGDPTPEVEKFMAKWERQVLRAA